MTFFYEIGRDIHRLPSCISIILAGLPNASAASAPSVRLKIDERGLNFDIRNPAANSVPIYYVKVIIDSTATSGKAPSGWSAKQQASTHTSTTVFSTASKPLLPGKSLQFTVACKGIVTAASWSVHDKNGKATAQGAINTPFYRLIKGLGNNDLLLNAAIADLGKNDFDAARNDLKRTRDSLHDIRADYEIAKYDITKANRKSVEDVLAGQEKLINFIGRVAVIEEKSRDIVSESREVPPDDVKRLLSVTKEFELLGYSFVELADDADSLSADLVRSARDSTTREVYVRRGYDVRDFAGTLSDFSPELKGSGHKILDLASEIYRTYDVDQSAKNTEIPTEGRSASNPLIPADLARFFNTFDADHDWKIDLTEAQAFYSWVELNIVYRYDDENESRPTQGTVVGDSRKGSDSRQAPYQTYKERVGDCEDMATLEQAFYSYFGIAAYVVGVNTAARNGTDHAATVVLIAGSVDDYQSKLGDLVYYDFSDGGSDVYGTPITDGIYMLVDNAYSDAFGYLSNGLEEGTFSVSCIIPLEYGYGDEWAKVASACAIPFD